MSQAENFEDEIVRPVGRKIMPNKLQFDHQKSKIMKNKQEKSQIKGSRDTNTVKPVRWNSMECVELDFSCDRAEESHSDQAEKVQDEKTPGS